MGDVLEAIGPEPTLAVLFVTQPLTGTFDDIVGAVQQMLRATQLVAITTTGVLGCGSEVEDGSALALWAVAGGSAETFLLPAIDPTNDAILGPISYEPLPCAETSSGLLLLADAASFDAANWISAQNPRRAIAGACFGGALRQARSASDASPSRSAKRPGNAPNIVYRNGTKVVGGAVAVAFGPEFLFDSLVVQSSRPVGQPFTVTKAERNVIYAMGGMTASEALDRTVEQCDERERTLLRQGIHLGVVVNAGLGLRRDFSESTSGSPEHPSGLPDPGNAVASSSTDEIETFGPGDFVVHHVLGADRNAKAIAITGTSELGDIVQFHVNDAQSARFECQQRVAEAMSSGGPLYPNAYGALMFPSVSRGTNLFGTDHHDAGVLGEYSSVASSGAFCQRQIGPVGDDNGEHQSALTIALIRSATA